MRARLPQILGELADLPAPRLGAAALGEALKNLRELGVDPRWAVLRGRFPWDDLSIRNEVEGARIEAAPIRVRTTLWNPNRVAYDFSGTHALAVTQGRRAFRPGSMSIPAVGTFC